MMRASESSIEEIYENLDNYYKVNVENNVENEEKKKKCNLNVCCCHCNNCFKEFIKDAALIIIPLVLVVGGTILFCLLL